MSSFHKDGKEVDFIAPAGGAKQGTIIQVAGTVGIVNPTHDNVDLAVGEKGVARIVGVVMVPNPDSVVVAEGGLVEYALATDKITAQAGGDYDIGHAVFGSNGANDVAVLLPGPAPTA